MCRGSFLVVYSRVRVTPALPFCLLGVSHLSELFHTANDVFPIYLLIPILQDVSWPKARFAHKMIKGLFSLF